MYRVVNTWFLFGGVGGSVKVKVPQSCPTLCDPMDLKLSRLLCPWDSPGKNTGVGSLSLLQGNFPTQGLNPGLLHCRWILYQLSHQGSPGKWWKGKQSGLFINSNCYSTPASYCHRLASGEFKPRFLCAIS